MYLFQIHFKDNTPAHIALSRITGIGNRMAIQTCDRLGVSQYITLANLSSSQITQLNQLIHQNFIRNGEYRTFIRGKIKRLQSISCYRGFRHLQGLPCRGQRTHTNARTLRKKRKSQTDSRKKVKK